MKKTKSWKYLRHQARRMKKCARQRKSHKSNRLIRIHKNVVHSMKYGGKPHSRVFPEISAPKDFRFIENTDECAKFFKLLRSNGNISERNYERFKTVRLTEVGLIDFPAVHTLTAICKELKCSHINVYGNLPHNDFCRKFMIDSGFLDNKYDRQGNLFRISSQTETMSFEMGQGSKLQTKHIINLLNISTNISKHLSNVSNDYPRRLMPILKEICGNSIDWSESYKKQWFFAARFDEQKVVVAVIDLGQGILMSLERKFVSRVADFFQGKKPLDILEGAFKQKYGSKSREVNRNKGLPSIRFAHEHSHINDLVVITNNVILSFGSPTKSHTFATSKSAFNGTIYCFTIDSNCLTA